MFLKKDFNYKTVQINEFLHKKIKVLAAKEGKSITELIDRVLSKEIRKG